jgi:PIN domain nuclease of toxin-antitoxin system
MSRPVPLPTVLDTHIWIWMVEGEAGSLADSAIQDIETAARAGMVFVSAISVWEVAMLEARGRITLSQPVGQWVAAALNIPGVRLLPLSPEIAVESANLPGEPHGDPADRILIASARSIGGRLATRDHRILAYSKTGNLAALDCTS